MRRLSIGLLTAFFLTSLTANTALPPMEDEERDMLADDIVEGTVLQIEQEVVDSGGGFVDTHYWVTLHVDNVLKGQNIGVGQDMKIFYWQVRRRPRGWAGPSGQSGNVRPLSSIRAYLKSTDGFELLEPNGFVEITR